MQYIKKPNLPQTNVSEVILSKDCPYEIVNELENNNIVIQTVGINPFVDRKISCHPDINILHLGEKKLLCAHYIYKQLAEHYIDAEVYDIGEGIQAPYPTEAGLNIAIVGKNIIFNEKSISKQAFGYLNPEAYRSIGVRQGYTKCNVVPVTEDAIITEDVSIYNACRAHMDVLLIESGSIALNGYPYGFIGGACGKIHKDTLAITGKLNYIKEYKSILSFCKNHNVAVLELTNQRPMDIGSIIPIKEQS